jgi:hypothetical protein
MTKAHTDFLNHGHGLANSNWSAWYCAYQYAAEINSPLLGLIDRGCNYAYKQQHVPAKFLSAAEKLYRQAIDSVSGLPG